MDCEWCILADEIEMFVISYCQKQIEKMEEKNRDQQRYVMLDSCFTSEENVIANLNKM